MPAASYRSTPCPADPNRACVARRCGTAPSRPRDAVVFVALRCLHCRAPPLQVAPFVTVPARSRLPQPCLSTAAGRSVPYSTWRRGGIPYLPCSVLRNLTIRKLPAMRSRARTSHTLSGLPGTGLSNQTLPRLTYPAPHRPAPRYQTLRYPACYALARGFFSDHVFPCRPCVIWPFVARSSHSSPAMLN